MLRLNPDSRSSARQLLANRWLLSALHAWEVAQVRDGAMQPPVDTLRFEQSCKLLDRIAQGVADAAKQAELLRSRRETVSSAPTAALPSPEVQLPSAESPPLHPGLLPLPSSSSSPPPPPPPPKQEQPERQEASDIGPLGDLPLHSRAPDELPDELPDSLSVCSAPQVSEPLTIEPAKVARLAQQLGITVDVVKYALSSKCAAAGVEVRVSDDDDS
jgi:hypothetical protein